MYHEYYHFGREELLKGPKIPLIIMEDNSAVFRELAREMAVEFSPTRRIWGIFGK